MNDATNALLATGFYLLSSTTGIPDVVEQSIAICVLISVVVYLLGRQERFNQEFIKEMRSNSEAVTELAGSIAALTKSNEQSQEDSKRVIEILLSQLESERANKKEPQL